MAVEALVVLIHISKDHSHEYSMEIISKLLIEGMTKVLKTVTERVNKSMHDSSSINLIQDYSRNKIIHSHITVGNIFCAGEKERMHYNQCLTKVKTPQCVKH